MEVPPVIAVLRPIAVMACGLAAALLVSCSSAEKPADTPSDQSTPAAPASSAAPQAPLPPAPMSDEDQIREALKASQDAYNTQNWDAYLEMLCPVQRAKFTGEIMNMVKKGRAENGLSFMTVTSVAIDGDTAKATVEASNEVLGTQTLTLPLERSDGWKLCVKDGTV
jgi:hypothetical protein